ncbi:MAG: glycosyltransferase family 9 protein [PVC group bacterium]
MQIPRKILIVKLGSIGDVVNTLPLVNALKESRPDAKICWLIEPKSFPAVEGHRAVDRFIVHHRGGGLAAARAALGEVRDFQPDLVIDLQRILRSSFFTALSGCRERLGFDRKRCKEFSWFFTNRKIPPRSPRRHMVLQYLEFAAFLGFSPAAVRFRLPVSESDRSAARALIPGFFLDPGFIALNIGAAKAANRWPPARWSELAGRILTRTPYSVVLTGGERDAARGNAVGERLGKEERVKDCTGQTSLKQLGGLFTLSRAVVSGDTGPMHISSALGIRTIGIFGPADPGRTGPFRHLDLVVRAGAACSPCGKRRCRSAQCLDEITAGMVFSKIFPSSRHAAGVTEKFND